MIDTPIYVKTYGNSIFLRGFDENMKEVQGVYDYTPEYYIRSSNQSDAVSLYGDNLRKYSFDSIKESKAWLKRMKDEMIDVFGNVEPHYQLISELPKTLPITKDSFRVLYYDIETTTEHGKIDVVNVPETIILISTYDTITKKAHLFSTKDYKFQGLSEKYSSYEVIHHKHTSEFDMLIDFLRYWKDVNPHITTGWNTDGFDDPYIYHRIKKVLGDKEASSLSPFGKVNVRTYEKFGKAETSVDFVGVACLDYKQIYETFTFHSMPDYKLDTVAEYELGENKVEYEGSFKDFYTNEWDKFCTYSVKDTVLVRELDLKTDLMSVAITVAQFCGVNLADTFGSVNKIDVACYNFLKNRNKIIPPKKEVESGSYPGAFVREPKPGLYTAVASFDLASLYPSIIRQHNISPETLVRNKDKTVSELSTSVSIEKMVNGSIDLSALKEYNYSLCPNGAVYDHNKVGFLAELMTEWYNGRKTEKKNSFNHWNNAKSAKEELKKRGISV